MSGAYRLHLKYCGGDVAHIELHGVGSFLVGLSVYRCRRSQTVQLFSKIGLTKLK